MIAPKTARPSKADEADAYEIATLRDKDTCQKCRRPGLVVHRDHRQNRDAKAICESCDVRAQCLQWALDNHEDFGIWGGKSPRQRRKLRAAREDTVTHGTNAMYNRGCHNPATCPRSSKGTSCSEAHRRYDRKHRLTQGSAA